MSTLTCLAVALLIAQTAALKTRFTPIGSPLETVCSNTSRTWMQLDQLCNTQFPGYRLLQRSYRQRPRDVRAQELRGLIPLRVKRANYIVYWVNDFGIDDEEVDADFLLDMQVVDPSSLHNVPNVKDVGPNIQVDRLRMQYNRPSVQVNTPSIRKNQLNKQDVGSSVQHTGPRMQDKIQDNRPKIHEYGPKIQDYRPNIREYEPNIKYVGPSIQHTGPKMQHKTQDGPKIQEYGPKIQGYRPNIREYESNIKYVGPSIQHIGPKMQENEPKRHEYGPIIREYEPNLKYVGPSIQDVVLTIQDARHNMQDARPSMKYIGPNIQKVELSIRDDVPRIQHAGPSGHDNSVDISILDTGTSMQDNGPSIRDNKCSIQDVGTSMQDNEHCIQDVGSSIRDNGPRILDNQPSMQDGVPCMQNGGYNVQIIGPSSQDVGRTNDDLSIQDNQATLQDVDANMKDVWLNIRDTKPGLQDVDPNMKDVWLSIQDIEPSLQEVDDEEGESIKHGSFVIPQPRGKVHRSAEHNAMVDGGGFVGALDLANMRWRLVDKDYQFSSLARDRPQNDVCAICEMMSRSDVRSPLSRTPDAPEPLNIYRLNVRSLRPSRRASSPADDRSVMQALAEVLGLTTADIEVESSPLKRDGEELQFLILLSSSNMRQLLSKRMIAKRFLVTGVDNLTVCRAENTTRPVVRWPETEAGNVVIKGSREKIFVTRECIQTLNSVEWGNPVVWKESTQSSKKPLWKQTEPNLSDMLHKLANNKLNDIHNWRGNLDIGNNGDPVNNKANLAIESNNHSGTMHRSIRETVDFLHSLASIPVKSRYLDVVAEELNKILQLDRANLSILGNNPMRLALDLERIVTNMILESGHDTMAVVKSNVALLVADVHNTDNPLSGVTLSSTGGDDAKMSLNEIYDYNAHDVEYSNGVEVSTLVPQSLISSSRRVAFTIFSDDKLFQGNTSDHFVLHSRIINIAVDGNPNFPLADGEFVEISFKSDNNSLEKKCVFWSFTMKDWSTQGCTLGSSNGRDICRCNHLTHFALLITPPKHHQTSCYRDPLQVLTLICCLISLVGLLSINMTLMLFSKWQKEFDSLIVLNLSSAMALNIIVYLVSTFLDLRHNHTVCVVMGILLHYSVLACFCWMLVVASLQVYCIISTKGVAGNAFTFCKAFLFAWGLPLIPVFTLLFGECGAYRYQSDRHFCYPHGKAFYQFVVGPVAIIMALNAIAFTIVVCNIYECCCWKNVYKRRYVIEEVAAIRRLKTTIFLFFLFGLPWSFGFFAYKHVSFAYLFCLTATLQGFILCTFIVMIEGHTRVMWRRLLFGK